MLKLLISCWYDGVVVACRYMFAMGSDVVLVLLLLYCTQWLLWIFLSISEHFLLHTMYWQIHRPIYTYSCTYLFFTLHVCIGFHAVFIQPKFHRSCPHYIRRLIRPALACTTFIFKSSYISSGDKCVSDPSTGHYTCIELVLGKGNNS